MTTHQHVYIDTGADISECGKYRYMLWREWGGAEWYRPLKPCVFVMLNPSTADGKKDDPTIRRCVGFAKSLGYERLEVVNLFAYRAKRPADLLALTEDDDPVGPRNLDAIHAAARRAGILIAAWGSLGTHLGQDRVVLDELRKYHVSALELTLCGFPRHPLYLPASARPFPYVGRSP